LTLKTNSQINVKKNPANITVKNFQFKTVCDGDMAYITQLKQQN